MLAWTSKWPVHPRRKDGFDVRVVISEARYETPFRASILDVMVQGLGANVERDQSDKIHGEQDHTTPRNRNVPFGTKISGSDTREQPDGSQMGGIPFSPQNGEQGWQAEARWAESGSETGFAKAVEPRQTDRSDKPVPEATCSRRIVLPGLSGYQAPQAHWITGKTG